MIYMKSLITPDIDIINNWLVPVPRYQTFVGFKRPLVSLEGMITNSAQGKKVRGRAECKEWMQNSQHHFIFHLTWFAYFIL